MFLKYFKNNIKKNKKTIAKGGGGLCWLLGCGEEGMSGGGISRARSKREREREREGMSVLCRVCVGEMCLLTRVSLVCMLVFNMYLACVVR